MNCEGLHDDLVFMPQVANRARGDQQRGPQPSQNRGQDLDQPITPAPLPRRPAANPFAQQQNFDPRPAFQPTPQEFDPRPAASVFQQPAAQDPRFAATASFQQAQQQEFDPRPAAPNAFQQRVRPTFQEQQQQEQEQPATDFSSFQPTPLPQRPAEPQSAPVPAAPASSSSGGSFSNFPARDNPARGRTRLAIRPSAGAATASTPRGTSVARGGSSQSSAGRRPTPAPAQEQQQQAFQSFPATQQQPQAQPAPIRPAFEEVNLPSFTSFQPGQSSVPAGGAARFQPAAARPALTFQDQPQQQQQQFAPAQQEQQQQQLPKSALEIVDFNQLLQEFQGSRNGRPANSGFQQFPARF